MNRKACRRGFFWAGLFLALTLDLRVYGESLLAQNPSKDDFVLSAEAGAATIFVEKATDPAIVRAASDLVSDVERVSDRKPELLRDAGALSGNVVLVGVLGHSPLIDNLVAAGKLDATGAKGSWESYVVQVVESPLPHVRRALVIAGSDRRGAIYGLYEISAAIGVSPWYWWADVAPTKQKQLVIAAGTRRFGPPSVKYRGIFINDEDWGLHPWAAKTFEPENGSIGPKTYAKVFELLLRLKANTLWPGMHAVTKPFNSFAENARIADDYGIVMGSSHAEPMLRNNVGEWKDAPERYNYISNRDGVLKYWDERVAANGRFENIYTLGMRGIHDSGMRGPKTDSERIRTLEQIFSDQRALLAKHVRADIEHVPQIFCAYKEVLPLYRSGLRVPDDVTVMFPDDNFGYIRDFPASVENARKGGSGVYYHLSYLGAPMSYLWLCTTPPALVWEEMTKAYTLGAERIWIANVGDLKPGEIVSEFFFQLAWDVHRWDQRDPNEFLTDWAAREFGSEAAPRIAAVLRDYYLLNYQRKPEHLQWWLPGKPPQPSPMTSVEIQERLKAFASLRARADDLLSTIPPTKRDAFFELVSYPVHGSALANERYFSGELSVREAALGTKDAAELAARAQAADAQLRDQTRIFNDEIAGGKWRGIISLEPADRQWSSMRLDQWTLPHFPAERIAPTNVSEGNVISREAGHYDRKTNRPGARWESIPGLGRTGRAVTVLPANAPGIRPESLNTDSPTLEYDFNFPAAGKFPVSFYLVPTHPLAGNSLRFAIAIDDAQPQQVSLDVNDGGAEWTLGVLNATRLVTAPLIVPTPGVHRFKIVMIDAGVVLDKIVVALSGSGPGESYLGSPENARTEPH